MPGPQTLTNIMRITANEENALRREYRRGQLAALADIQHILNVAIHELRTAGERPSHLEQFREALHNLNLGM